MSIISWKCRGLGRAKVVRGLKSLVRKSSPAALFLIETKVSEDKLSKIGKGLPFDNVSAISASNSAGGIALLWSNEISWKIVYKSNWIIGVRMDLTNGTSCNCWFCYCPAKRTLRRFFWTELLDLVKTGSEVWLCMGNFNDITGQEEKSGGRKVSRKSHWFLRNFVFNVGGIDMGFCGSNYTWCNRRGGIANIRERLDRVVVSVDWRILFNQAGVLHLPPAGSDHLPIQLNLKQDHPKLPRPFRFLEAWTRDPTCEEVELEDQLEQLASVPPSEEIIKKSQELQSAIDEWRLRLELVWRQKSRELRLKEGDRNSKFFHATTVAKRRKNQIVAIKDDNDNWLDSRLEIGNYLTRKFEELYSGEPLTFCDNLEEFRGVYSRRNL
nr:uncharacterized protein LOC125418477 [Ziziphus jujuba var. spinosa]